MSFGNGEPSLVKLLYKGREVAITGVTCAHCGNDFFVEDAREFQPKHCAYCGVRFRFYSEDPNPAFRSLAGGPLNGDKPA